ncbi:MAG: dihydrolipoamide succinyltransferase, partial [Aromatoleum sp.]|nr:dihydrolipoamide succinyltransferase [Aromatoleum sp.]
MRIEVTVPQLPESVAEATLVNWHKKVGEAVKRDENLIDIETDKVVLELPAPGDGILVELRKGDGATVLSQEVIAVIDSDAKATVSAAPPRMAQAPPRMAQAPPLMAQASARMAQAPPR